MSGAKRIKLEPGSRCFFNVRGPAMKKEQGETRTPSTVFHPSNGVFEIDLNSDDDRAQAPSSSSTGGTAPRSATDSPRDAVASCALPPTVAALPVASCALPPQQVVLANAAADPPPSNTTQAFDKAKHNKFNNMIRSKNTPAELKGDWSTLKELPANHPDRVAFFNATCEVVRSNFASHPFFKARMQQIITASTTKEKDEVAGWKSWKYVCDQEGEEIPEAAWKAKTI